MEALFQDLRFGFRMLARKPGFTLMAVLTLALGIGANTAIFGVINAVLLRPLPYPDSNRLVMVSHGDDESAGNTSFASYVDWRERNSSFEQMAVIRSWGVTLTGQGDPEMINGLRVSSNYFQLLAVTPELGCDFRPEEDRPNSRFVVALSHSLWQRPSNKR